MANVIEQIVQPKNFGTQTIEMTVRSNERGPQGKKGDTGDAATVNAGDVYTIGYGQNPQVLNRGTSGDAILDFYLPEGKPGAIHYTAGPGINITEENVIEATGEAAVHWGDLTGNINSQTDLMNKINAKQDKLTAGTNISISGNTISSTSYTAGSGLNLNTNEFSVDTDTIQTKLTAGSNVQINAGTISATDTTYNNFIGADGGSGGSAGLVPAPVASDNTKVLKGDGTWGTVTSAGIDKLSLLNVFYPVGSYYETSDTTFDPNVAWGGTWVEDTDGKVLVAQDTGTFDTVGDTGGAESHRHDFKIGIKRYFGALVGDNWDSNSGAYSYANGSYSKEIGQLATTAAQRNNALTNGMTSYNEATITSLGDTDLGSSLQPYIVVRRWHRTA